MTDNKSKKRNFNFYPILIVGSILLISLTNKPVLKSYSTNRFLRPPELLIQNSMGYATIMADVFWLRLIQDYDFCENESASRSYNPGKSYSEILETKMNRSRCDKGWVYHMVDFITDVDPRFEKPYFTGAVTLSVAVDDREGARLIFEKGVKRFPKDWSLAYSAAYHYLFELQNPERAADLLLQANRYGGPSWLPVLAARLYTSAGRKTLGVSVLEEYLKTNPEGDGAKRARERLEKLRAEPD